MLYTRDNYRVPILFNLYKIWNLLILVKLCRQRNIFICCILSASRTRILVSLPAAMLVHTSFISFQFSKCFLSLDVKKKRNQQNVWSYLFFEDKWDAKKCFFIWEMRQCFVCDLERSFRQAYLQYKNNPLCVYPLLISVYSQYMRKIIKMQI